VGKLKQEFTVILDRAIRHGYIDHELQATSIDLTLSVQEQLVEQKELSVLSEMATAILIKWDSVDLTPLEHGHPLKLLRSSQIQKILQFCSCVDALKNKIA
jgi:hypothetical protein